MTATAATAAEAAATAAAAAVAAAAAAAEPELQAALPVGAHITLSMQSFKLTGSSPADAIIRDRKEYGVAVFEVLDLAGRGGNADALVAQLISFKLYPSVALAAAAATAAAAAAAVAAGDAGVSWLLPPHDAAAAAKASSADWIDFEPGWGDGKVVLKLTRYPQPLPDLSEESVRKCYQGECRRAAALEATRYQALQKCKAVLQCHGWGVNTQVVRPAAEGGDAAARTFSSSSWCSGCLAHNIDMACLVLPYLEHGSLLARLRPAAGVCRPLSSYATAWVVSGVAEALVAMRKANVMFVDLTPANIMFTNGPARLIPTVCVIDLESSRPVTSAPAIDGSFGSPAYQAPDAVYTSRSDVFLLGLVCYTCLTGKVPPPDLCTNLHQDPIRQDPIWQKLRECEQEMLLRCLGPESQRPFPEQLAAKLHYFEPKVFSRLPKE